MGGGFGFGMLADVQMLGFYQAQHPRTRKPFLAYVLQVATTASAHFLIYRRYSQIAGLATKLHFHPSVGLPPKYALQVFPLTEEQLKQRFEGLQAFMGHVFMHLHRQFDEGAHHDVNSSAGLDMQIFYDFVAHHRNRPPKAVRVLPEWAKPTILHGVQSGTGTGSQIHSMAAFPYSSSMSRSSSASSLGNLESTRSHSARRSTWQDVDSVTDSEDVGMGADDGGDLDDEDYDESEDGRNKGLGDARVDTSNQFRNEILQAEGNLNALWNCVKAYTRATNAWWVAAGAVVDEYKRIGDMTLFNTPTPKAPSGGNSSSEEAATTATAAPGLAPVDELAVNTAQDVSQLEHEVRSVKEKELNRYHPTRLASVHNHMIGQLQPVFETKCENDVLAPLEALVRDVLPEVKHSYWTRLANMKPEGGSGSGAWQMENVNVRRLLQERESLHNKIKSDVQESMTALVKIQNELLRAMQTKMQPFESVAVRVSEQSGTSGRGVSRSSSATAGQLSVASQRQKEETPEKIVDAPVSSSNDENVPSTGKTTDGYEDDPNGVVDEQKPLVADDVESSPIDEELSVEQNENTAENGQDQERTEEELQAQYDEEEDTSSRVWVWGRPPTAEGGTPLVLRPKQVSLLNGQAIIQIACGGEHLLYLTDTGDVYSYGDNEEKRAFKRGHASSFLVPRLVEEFALEKALHRTKIIKVACGAQHSVGITEVGELYTWGSGEDGRLGHGDMRDRSVPRKVMSLLRERVVHASCGGAHTAVLTDKSKVFTFGRGRNGRLGLGDNKWRDTPHEVTTFARETAIVHVVCGWNFTAALGGDGSVYSWGKQGEGQCGLGYLDKDQLVPRNIEKLLDSHVVDIACGYTHTIALTSKGEVYSWGLGEYGQLGRGIVYQPVPELVDFSSVLCTPDRIVRVYCGAFHSVVTTDRRVMFSWGLNMYGACGLGHTANKDTPDRVDTFSQERELVVACGHKYTIALEVDQEAVVPAHKVRLSATQPGQLSIASGLGLGDTPPLLNMTIITTGSTNSLEWTATTPTNGDTTPKISYHVPGAVVSEKRETIHEKEEELRRAKKLWRTRILRDWEESKDTPLAHSMWRQGIPPSIRAKVWPLAIGNKLKVTPEMYQIYRKRAIAYKLEREASGGKNNVMIGREHTLALIDTDLPRTFPSLKLFDASGPYYEFLLEVLETYACYRPDLGYIQGMSYLAAMLCLHMPQDRYLTFQCLANLMVNEHLFTFYLLDAELSGVYYTLFDEFLSARLPALHKHMGAIGISCSMYLMNWLQTLFLQVLPLELAARVFDNFLLDGTVFLFRTAMAIHELLQADLLRAEIDEAMPIIQKNPLYQDLWYARVPEDELFRTISNIVVPSHIYSALDRVVNDVFFYEKRGTKPNHGDSHHNDQLMAHASGGQSVGIGRVKHERRRMYSISDTLNGVLGGF